MNLSGRFPKYTDHGPLVDVWCVTPGRGGAIHRFFDTSPFSPSGRYLAVCRLPREDRLPRPGDKASICVIDLQTGEDRVVAETGGWETQLGAHLNWGADDHTLFFNDIDHGSIWQLGRRPWNAFSWRLNYQTGKKDPMEGTVYQASPDGKTLASADLTTMCRTQYGYGVVIPQELVAINRGVRDDTGLWLTDTSTGKKKLVATLRQFVDAGGEAMGIADEKAVEVYGFHTKWSPNGKKLLFSLRWFDHDGTAKWDQLGACRFAVFTLNPDGSDIRLAVPPEQWAKGGHHINFFPSSRWLSMNLRIDAAGPMRLVKVGLDGSGLMKMHPEVVGSGHPNVFPDNRFVLTDAYGFEQFARPDGTVPLRWIDLENGNEVELVRIPIRQPYKPTALRVDPHPAFDRTWRWFAFNGYVGGTRRVFIANLPSLAAFPAETYARAATGEAAKLVESAPSPAPVRGRTTQQTPVQAEA